MFFYFISKKKNRFDFESSNSTVIGAHNDSTKSVEYSEQHNMIVSGSWDKTISFWDKNTSKQIYTVNQPERVYSMALSPNGNYLTVAHAERTIHIYDLRKYQKYIQKRNSPLTEQTRSLTAMPDNKGFTLSSMEGRVAVEYFDSSSSVQKSKYAFKCHRNVDKNSNETIYSVNAMAFNPSDLVFATGGSDGFVNIWDLKKKKKILQLHNYSSSIASLSYSPDGSKLAISASYMWENGDPSTNHREAIYIRNN